jgi:hypothetical protein
MIDSIAPGTLGADWRPSNMRNRPIDRAQQGNALAYNTCAIHFICAFLYLFIL